MKRFVVVLVLIGIMMTPFGVHAQVTTPVQLTPPPDQSVTIAFDPGAEWDLGYHDSYYFGNDPSNAPLAYATYYGPKASVISISAGRWPASETSVMFHLLTTPSDESSGGARLPTAEPGTPKVNLDGCVSLARTRTYDYLTDHAAGIATCLTANDTIYVVTVVGQWVSPHASTMSKPFQGLDASDAVLAQILQNARDATPAA